MIVGVQFLFELSGLDFPAGQELASGYDEIACAVDHKIGNLL